MTVGNPDTGGWWGHDTRNCGGWTCPPPAGWNRMCWRNGSTDHLLPYSIHRDGRKMFWVIMDENGGARFLRNKAAAGPFDTLEEAQSCYIVMSAIHGDGGDE